MGNVARFLISITFLGVGQVSLAQDVIARSDAPKKEISHPREVKARKLLRASQPEKTIALLNPYTDQLSIPAYLDLAKAYGQLKDVKNEVRILKILNDRDPNNYESHFVLGHGLLKLLKVTTDQDEKKKIDTELVEAFRKATKLAPKYKPSYDSLLNYFISVNLNYEARQLLVEMIDQFGRRPELLNDQCRLFSIDGYLNQTVSHCKQAIASSKRYPDNYVYLAQAYIEKGEEEKGGKIIRLAAKKFPRSEITQWAAGKYYFDKQNYPVSSRYFNAAVNADPKKDRSQLGLGKSLFEEKKFVPALKHLLSACQIDQTHKDELIVAATKLRLDKKYSIADKYKRNAYNCIAKSK